jgi:hypothetical protein
LNMSSMIIGCGVVSANLRCSTDLGVLK